MGVLKGEPAGDTSRLALRLEGKGVYWEAHADQQNNWFLGWKYLNSTFSQTLLQIYHYFENM